MPDLNFTTDADGNLTIGHGTTPLFTLNGSGIASLPNAAPSAPEDIARMAEVNAASSTFDGTTASLSVSGWRVIDVSNHGFPGDRTGGDLAAFIDSQMVDGGKYVFVLPDGTYNWNRKVGFGSTDATHGAATPDTFALIGKPEATLYVDIGATETHRNRICLECTNAIRNISMQNLHFDVGVHDSTRDAGIIRAKVGEQGYFNDISITGRRRWEAGATSNEDQFKNGDRMTFKLDVVNPDGAAHMNRLYFPEGDIYETGAVDANGNAAGHAIPISSETPHVGTAKWTNCYLEGFVDNGYYLRDGSGAHIVIGCTAKDCGAGGFRLGRNDYAKRISAILANPQYNGTGIWVEDRVNVGSGAYTPGTEDDTATVIDGFEVIATGGAINTVTRFTNHPTETVLKNGYIRIGEGVNDYAISATADTGKLGIKNVTVDDHSSGAIRVASYRFGMDQIRVDNLTHRVHPPTGTAGRSIFQIDATDVKIKNSYCEGTTKPMIEAYDGAEFTMVDCEFPHDGSTSSPFLIRHNEVGTVGYVSLRYNDVRGYTGGLGMDPANIVTTRIVGNRGLADSNTG